MDYLKYVEQTVLPSIHGFLKERGITKEDLEISDYDKTKFAENAKRGVHVDLALYAYDLTDRGYEWLEDNEVDIPDTFEDCLDCIDDDFICKQLQTHLWETLCVETKIIHMYTFPVLAILM